MNFNIVDGSYADLNSIHDDFVQDYIFSNELSNKEIRKKYNLSHKEFRELSEEVKKEHGLSRRLIVFKDSKYYYKAKYGFMIQKRLNGRDYYVGHVPTEDVARKVVELCKKVQWDIDVCRKICKNWNKYSV